jgi:hypothetical protein
MESHIDNMVFHKVLNYAQGVMVHEEVAESRVSLPFTDSSGMQQYENAKQERLNGLWDIMFPISSNYIKWLHAQSDERKKQLEGLRRLRDG